jgi:hypothetical protein
LGQYANAKVLSQYIPELDPNHPRAITLRVKMAKRAAMLKKQVAAATVVVIVNLSMLAWVATRYPPNFRGMGTILLGDCTTVNQLNSTAHVLLNMVSSLALGAGNFCMQVLAAPSRNEMNIAHGKGVCLEIGIPSVKNLRHVERQRVTAWVFIGLVSILLHLL